MSTEQALSPSLRPPLDLTLSASVSSLPVSGTLFRIARFFIDFFSHFLAGGQKYLPPSRVDFDLRVGVDAEDYDSIAVAEELSPLEVELRKLEDASVALNKHMNYMRKREAAMRNTNGKDI